MIKLCIRAVQIWGWGEGRGKNNVKPLGIFKLLFK